MTFAVAASLLVGSAITTSVSPPIAIAHQQSTFVGLQAGSRGPLVKTVQRALMAKGSYVHGGVDGIFGTATAMAVRAFQEVNGLPSTGRIDVSTARLLGLGSEQSSPIYTYRGGVIGLKMGANSTDVAALQRALGRAGMFVDGGADGFFGPATHAALVSYQRRNGLTANGIVDRATASALRLPTSSGSGGGTPGVAPGSIGQGASGDAVRSIQRAIVRAGGFLLGGVDGVYGPATTSAVKAYQIVNDLPVTGVVDASTARVMGVSVRGGGTPTPPNGGSSLLRVGSRGDAVRQMQRALSNAGIYVLGGADGVFGPGTLSALRSFQQRRSLPVSGVYDAPTRWTLAVVNRGGGGGGTRPPSRPADPRPPSNGYVGLRQGSVGPAVRAVQQAIMRTGMTLLGGADGVFGPATTSALKLFQRTNGIAVSGAVDSATARVMGLGSSSDSPGTATGYAVYGERGARVIALQTALRNAGVSFAGGVDGSFGSATTGAIVRFRQLRGLSSSGRVDSSTARALGLSPMSKPQAPSAGSLRLARFPVQGPCWFGDTWQAPRGGGRYHLGVDIGAAQGQAVYAVTDGRIIQKYVDQPGSLSGNGLKLGMRDGTYFFYAHFSGFAKGVGLGTPVSAGQVIGYVGSTGNSAGPHLHFEVHPRGGAPVNPYPIVKAVDGC